MRFIAPANAIIVRPDKAVVSVMIPQPLEGIVIAVGPFGVGEDGQPVTGDIRAGDRAFFMSNASTKVALSKEPLLIVKVRDVLAIQRDEEAGVSENTIIRIGAHELAPIELLSPERKIWRVRVTGGPFRGLTLLATEEDFATPETGHLAFLVMDRSRAG